jgi:hypothetical protein
MEVMGTGSVLSIKQRMRKSPEDEEARAGHKSVDSSFFGYKTHMAMTDERIITADIVTTGEKNDGKQLQTLVEKSKTAGIEVKTVIGDTAYSEKDNIIYTSNYWPAADGQKAGNGWDGCNHGTTDADPMFLTAARLHLACFRSAEIPQCAASRSRMGRAPIVRPAALVHWDLTAVCRHCSPPFANYAQVCRSPQAVPADAAHRKAGTERPAFGLPGSSCPRAVRISRESRGKAPSRETFPAYGAAANSP